MGGGSADADEEAETASKTKEGALYLAKGGDVEAMTNPAFEPDEVEMRDFSQQYSAKDREATSN